MTATTGPLLEARGLALGYGRRRILTNVTLTIAPGEVWFLLGPNGAGKTTLLRSILGALPPSAGELRLHPELARRERIGFVPQRCDLNAALPTTVREFVLLGLVGLPATRREETARLEWALGRTGLAGMARRDYWSLSGGERQRALVARALVRRPGLLILDEPTTHLDPGTEEAVLGLLRDLNRTEGMTLLVVTHDLAIAARFATHLALLSDGTVTAGPRARMLEPAALARAFGTHVEVPAP